MKIEQTLPELTDREESIKAYLERDETLPDDILDEVLLQFWTQEPFKSRGFVLDGFPNNEAQAQYMIQRGLYPDAVVILRVDDETVTKRLLGPRLTSWKEKVAARKAKRLAKANRKKEKLVKL